MKTSQLLVLLLLLIGSKQAVAQLQLNLESGLTFNTMNDVRYPNGEQDNADLIDIPEVLGTSNTWFYRFRTSYTIADRHTFSLLYAPLTFESEGMLGRSMRFGDVTFGPNENVKVGYTFNSYRFTYRYLIASTDKLRFGLGLTAKIRDAEIAFSTEIKSDRTTDLGFVPLINFRLDYLINETWKIRLDGDALVGPQGRAEDIFVGAFYELSAPLSLFSGYRILEGGADVDQVYNFSLIHYASAGAVWTF